jgi:hypothetical protein
MSHDETPGRPGWPLCHMTAANGRAARVAQRWLESGRILEVIATAGRDAVLDGSHDVEGPPTRTGRWGPSIVLLPTGELADALAALTSGARAAAGAGHWASGWLGRAHLTVRALEHFIERPIPTERRLRYLSALDRAGRGVGQVQVELSGVLLSKAGILATAWPTDGAADELRERLEAELGADAWLERRHFDHGRDPIWYCTLVHFAGPIADPASLLAWIDAHAEVEVGGETFTSARLCQWTFDGTAMAPIVIG